MVRDGDSTSCARSSADGKAANRMIGSYRAIIKERTAEHSQVLHSLAEDSVPALMHCAAGKDRAGLSIAITLLALGVEREAIVADYLESNAAHRRYKVHRSSSSDSAYSPEVMELLSPLFDARAEYLAAAFETIEETWGGVDAYLEQGAGRSPRSCGSGCASGSSTDAPADPASRPTPRGRHRYWFCAPSVNSR